MKRVGVNDAGMRSILRLMILHTHEVGQEDVCIPRAVVLELKVKVVNNQQIVVPMVLIATGFLQGQLGGIGSQVGFQSLADGLYLFLLRGKQ